MKNWTIILLLFFIVSCDSDETIEAPTGGDECMFVDVNYNGTKYVRSYAFSDNILDGGCDAFGLIEDVAIEKEEWGNLLVIHDEEGLSLSIAFDFLNLNINGNTSLDEKNRVGWLIYNERERVYDDIISLEVGNITITGFGDVEHVSLFDRRQRLIYGNFTATSGNNTMSGNFALSDRVL